MKLRIIRPFYDKVTGELYKADTVAEFKKDRALEIMKRLPDYVEEVKEKKAKKKEA